VCHLLDNVGLAIVLFASHTRDGGSLKIRSPEGGKKESSRLRDSIGREAHVPRGLGARGSKIAALADGVVWTGAFADNTGRTNRIEEQGQTLVSHMAV